MFGAGLPHHNGGFYERLGKANEIRILDKAHVTLLLPINPKLSDYDGLKYQYRSLDNMILGS